MTLANLVSTGSGKLNARWEIEGLALQFVTDPAMEQTLTGSYTGVQRVCVTSLEDCGFAIEESVNIPEAKLEVKTTVLNLWETDAEILSGLFNRRPSVERFGAVSFAYDATGITLLSTSGISGGDVIHVGTEAIKVGSVSNPNLTGCTRAYWGTIARKHWASDTPGVPELLVTDRPLRFRGRRVTLYLYGDSDPLDGDGNAVWRGVVADEPRLVSDGTMYQVPMAGNAMLLDARLGTDLDEPAKPRGVYYTASAGLSFSVTEALASSARNTASGVYTGFSETNDAFVSDFNAWLAALTSGFDSTYEATLCADGWTILCVVGPNTVALDRLHVESEQDGESRFARDMRQDDYDGPEIGFDTPASGQRLFMRWYHTVPGGAGQVPRGYFGFGDRRDAAATLTAPSKRVYLGRSVGSDWSGATFDLAAPTEFRSYVGPITSLDTSGNWIEWTPEVVIRGDSMGARYTQTEPLTVRPYRELRTAALPTWAGFGTVAELMTALTEEAVTYGDLGTTPFIVAADVDLDVWTGTAHAAAITPWQRSRRYYLASPVDVMEFLSHELRAVACYPCTDSAGKIIIRPVKLPNANDAAIVDITEEVMIVNGDGVPLSSLVRGNQTINRITFRTGYDAIEDDWSGYEEVNDHTAQALDHQDRELVVEPRSYSNRLISADEAGLMALPVLSLFGYPLDYWSPKLPWTAFDLRLGTPITFDAAHLPDYTTGTRPITDAVGIVVGRKWALSEAYGELQIIVSWQNIAGYSPTARVLSQNDNGGNNWTLTVDHSRYSPLDTDGSTVLAAGDSFFEVGQQVLVMEVDVENAGTGAGLPLAGEVTADSSGSGTITVTFDSTWTPGVKTWDLIYDHYDAAGVTAQQKTFAAFAGTDGLLGAGDANPRTLAP